ncbi:MAG: SUMF1/EgtB/PvdO family nonheme iron enzyme [Elusimicrobia bacterium]|nr:SUMF1/EgtB/PvdO family nonheme iron enzyme [Elusimicrobiota bacterium]
MKPIVFVCPRCGGEVNSNAKVCGTCGQSLGMSWLLRALRRGVLIGLLIAAAAAGFAWMRVSLEKGIHYNENIDGLRSAINAAENACPPRGCPPEVVQAKGFYNQAVEEAKADNYQEAAKSIKSAKESLARAEKRSAQSAAAAVSPSTGTAYALVAVPAGEFLMGSFDAGLDHHPPHPVSLRAFSIGAREVTVEEYREYCRQTQQSFPEPPPGSTSRHPVALVTWHEAKAYCEHLGLRLPTEAEWEKAARCGLEGKTAGGMDPEGLGRLAWHKGNSQGQAHPVQTKAASSCGLYDFFGNAAEWVSDWYAADYYQASPQQDPAGPQQGEDKVLRGGSCKSPVESLGAHRRGKSAPESGRDDIGFRCVKGL